MKEESEALNFSSLGGEVEPSTIGRAGLTLRPPMVAVRSIDGGGIVGYGNVVCCLVSGERDIVQVLILI